MAAKMQCKLEPVNTTTTELVELTQLLQSVQCKCGISLLSHIMTLTSMQEEVECFVTADLLQALFELFQLDSLLPQIVQQQEGWTATRVLIFVRKLLNLSSCIETSGKALDQQSPVFILVV